MIARDNCLRLSLIVAAFLIAAFFLLPQLAANDYRPALIQPVEIDRLRSGAATSNNDKFVEAQPPTGAAIIPDLTSSEPSSTPVLDQPDAPVIPTPSAKPSSSDSTSPLAGGAKVSTLQAGKKLSPFSLTSPSGRYVFEVTPSGSLSLEDTIAQTELFTSDTEYYWPVEWEVELTAEGVLRLSWKNATAAPFHGTPWISSMLPNCDPVKSAPEAPVLELTDSGLLQIRVGSEPTCVLHRATNDKGRLALIYTGFLRTYLETCAEQRKKLVETWEGSGGADVHIFAYYEDIKHPNGDSVNKESIEKHLKDCFGNSLKSLELHKLKDVSEKAKNPSKILMQHCGQERLDHQLSQWKALYLAGQQVKRYMMRIGVRYDYIYKGRLDLKFWGTTPSLSSINVPHEGIIAPRVALDWTWYSMLHDGELHAGVTDITGFGRASTMFTYFSLYREFLNLRTTEKEVAKWKAFNSKDRVKSWENQELCTPEATLAYWLHLNGISVKTDWRFQMGLLRGDGALIFTCPEASKGRDFLCPGFIPNVNDDGAFY
jgi:hypothetical protein